MNIKIISISFFLFYLHYFLKQDVDYEGFILLEYVFGELFKLFLEKIYLNMGLIFKVSLYFIYFR
jgi:hypothetical protein